MTRNRQAPAKLGGMMSLKAGAPWRPAADQKIGGGPLPFPPVLALWHPCTLPMWPCGTHDYFYWPCGTQGQNGSGPCHTGAVTILDSCVSGL